MATIRQGKLAALVVIDAQKGVVARAYRRDEVIGAIRHAVGAAGIIADLNAAMSWLSYPGRKNRAVKAAEWSAE